MKLKSVIATAALCTTIITQSCEKNMTITARHATLHDLDAITELSHDLYQNHFQSIWEKYHGPSQFVHEKMFAADIAYKNIIEKQTNNESNEKLLVAELATNTETRVVGMCRFDKREVQKIYVKFLAIDKEFRRQGIATHFMNIMLNKFNDITTYEFRTLKDNEITNNMFIKYGCVQTGESTLDPKTGTITTDPNLPMIYNDYSYMVKK